MSIISRCYWLNNVSYWSDILKCWQCMGVVTVELIWVMLLWMQMMIRCELWQLQGITELSTLLTFRMLWRSLHFLCYFLPFVQPFSAVCALPSALTMLLGNRKMYDIGTVVFKTEWRLISATLCRWRHCFVADQLWFLMTCIREEEVGFNVSLDTL